MGVSVFLFCFMLSYVGRRFAMGRSPVQGVLRKFNEIFSGFQPLQVSVLNRRFEDHFGHHIIGNVIEFSRRESSKTYSYILTKISKRIHSL